MTHDAFGETSGYSACPRCGNPTTSPLVCARCADEQFGAELPVADMNVKTTFAGRCRKCGAIAQGSEPWDAIECAQCYTTPALRTEPNLGPAHVHPTENRPYVNPRERQAIGLERIAAALEKLTSSGGQR